MGSSVPKPEIITPAPRKEVKRGDDIVLECEANTREVTAMWLKNGQILHDDDRIKMHKRESCSRFALEISEACEDDEGEYTIKLSNGKGCATGSTKVTVLEYDKNWRNILWGKRKKESVKRTLREFNPSNPNVQHLRFLLHGPVGAGKSSIINSIKSIFMEKVQVQVPVTSSNISYTKEYTSYQIKDVQQRALPFVFNDIMGLEDEEQGGVLVEDIINVLNGHVKENYKFDHTTPLSEGSDSYESCPTLSDKVHCLVSVIPANKTSLLNKNDYNLVKKMQDVREAARGLGIPQVVFLTHVDECCPLVKKDLKYIYSSKAIKKSICECENMLGVPRNCIFPVKNYHEETRLDDDIDCLMLDALARIVDFTDDYITDKLEGF